MLLQTVPVKMDFMKIQIKFANPVLANVVNAVMQILVQNVNPVQEEI